MAWSYSEGVLTSTGATEASPDSLLAGIAVVQAADATRGYHNNLYGRLNNTRVDVALNSWVVFDNNGQFEFTGSTRMNPANESSANANDGGSLIFGFRMVLIVNTSTTYVDADCKACGSGGNFISRRSSSGINPLVIQQTTTRNDFPGFGRDYTPNRLDIGGLTIRNNGASRKLYFGLARNIVKVENVSFETTTGEYQTAQTTYQSAVFPLASHAGDSFINTSNFINTRWGTEQTGTISFGLNNVRYGNYINYDPVFPTSTWNGEYSGSNWFTDNRYAAALYSHTPTFRQAAAAVAGVNVRWTGERYSGTHDYTLSNIGEALLKSAVSGASGVVTTYLLSALRGRESSALQSSNKYRWTCKARAYGLKTAGETVWSQKSFLSDGQNGPLVEEVQMLPVANLTITEVQAAALSGITITPSGTNGGTVTVAANRTTSDLWHYYRWWISRSANFDSADTWTFDDTTLNMGAWSATGSQITGNVTTTGTIANDVVGVKLDANNAGQITVTGVGVSETAEMRLVSDNSLIASRTGSGAFSVSPVNVGASVYFVRLVGSSVVMSTVTTPVMLTAGINPEVPLYAGAQVQVAQASIIERIPVQLQVINTGIQRASLLVPHTESLP